MQLAIGQLHTRCNEFGFHKRCKIADFLSCLCKNVGVFLFYKVWILTRKLKLRFRTLEMTIFAMQPSFWSGKSAG
jgi:hypothetical protein